MTQALTHPLKNAFAADGYPWLLAQAYAAIGLGTTGDKMKRLRLQLTQGQHWLEYREPTANNSKRVCYTQQGLAAIAAKLGTEKALTFAAAAGQHRVSADRPGQMTIAQPQTPDTTYRMARVEEKGDLQTIAQATPLYASDWQEGGGMMATQPLQGFQAEALRVGLPDQVGGSVIINQGTIIYSHPVSQGEPLKLSQKAWERGAMALLLAGVFLPMVFLFAYIWGSILPRTVNVHMEPRPHAPLSY